MCLHVMSYHPFILYNYNSEERSNEERYPVHETFLELIRNTLSQKKINWGAAALRSYIYQVSSAVL